MLLRDVISKIDCRIPLSWAETWDNPGLNVGSPDRDISSIVIALDVNKSSVAQAVDVGAELLITHHPSIFRPLKRIVYNSNDVSAIVNAIKNNISLYSIHTNWDVSREGVNVILADRMSLRDCMPLYRTLNKPGVWGIGTVGFLPIAMTAEDFSTYIALRLNLTNGMFYSRNFERKLKKVAIAGGACGDMWYDALNVGADVFVTADISYHQREDALEAGMAVYQCDHGEMERLSLPNLKKIIEEVTLLPVTLIK